MKLTKVVPENVRWDEYSRFHTNHYNAGRSWGSGSAFVQFDTGELIVTSTFDGHPRGRHHYSDFNFQIISPYDRNFPTLTTSEGEVICKSWLSSNNLLIDADTKRVVRLERAHKRTRWNAEVSKPWEETPEWTRPIPVSLRERATAYFSGPGEPPVGAPVLTNQPKPLTFEERKHLLDLKAQVNAWCALTDQDIRKRDRWSGDNSPLKSEEVLEKQLNFVDLLETDRLSLARNGWMLPRWQREYTYLMVK